MVFRLRSGWPMECWPRPRVAGMRPPGPSSRLFPSIASTACPTTRQRFCASMDLCTLPGTKTGIQNNKDLIARKVGFKIALLADAVLLMKRAIAQNTIIAGPDRGSVADLIGQLGKGVEIWV